MPGTSVPLVVPGTTTRHEQLKQARRWLSTQRRANPPRFSTPAIQEVEKLFHKNDDVRSAHPHRTMSAEAASIVSTLEAERALSEDAGTNGDLWDGPERKGVTHAQQKDFKAAKQMAMAIQKGEIEAIGLDVKGEEVEDEALGAISFQGVDFGGWTFDHVGFEASDDSLAEEEAGAKDGDGDMMDLTEG